jgi:glutamine cyclotransferase
MMRAAAVLAAVLTMAVTRPPGFAAWPQTTAQAPKTPVARYTVVRRYPHDPMAFTQGLQYVDGVLYEGTGLNGRSSIRKVRLDTGQVLQQRDLGPEHFGEGITVWKSRLIELTWRSEVAFVYDVRTFEPMRTFRYTGEGWGLTHDATSLIMSDGSSSLRVLDPETFVERRRIEVTEAGTPVPYLNELEYVNGEVLANVWRTDMIARIEPATGRIVGWIDLAGLLTPAERRQTDVLNGIAWDEAGRRLFVTGKLWPAVFEIALR